MRELAKLQDWYLRHCDGDWEHTWGVKIDTLDNPGWGVIIDLSDTELENHLFEVVERHKTECDWMICRVSENRFEGAGGPLNLQDILREFNKWAKAHEVS